MCLVFLNAAPTDKVQSAQEFGPKASFSDIMTSPTVCHEKGMLFQH